ncbi:DUF6745 domain-containing protein [Microcoleus sp. herbarium14]|uniref:DUF6745 domain-containing protein n=1 Tax=Microcoleus sp. herbarium14 TaxID=3055439 RepID=UPI002FD66842
MPEQQTNQPINFTSFADWCKHKDSLSESARHTVEVLLKQAGTSDCNEADRILSNRTTLRLENHQISDITPLQFMTKLEWLRLGNNQISDITPLKFLTGLTDLSLENNPISKLTSLQSQWEVIARSTDRIDRTRAAAAIEFACAAVGETSIDVIICGSPHAAIAQLKKQEHLTQETDFIHLLQKKLKDECLITYRNGDYELARWEGQLEQELGGDFSNYRNRSRPIIPPYLLGTICVAEFCVCTFGTIFKPGAQKALECFQQLLTECGWIFAFYDVCYVCDRPTKLCLDSEHRLHAEGESAIEFSDGYKLYSYHGVTLPEAYGQIHPDRWQATWLLEEDNAEVRRVLIQGIGYARICSELQATELDCWKEYTLLRIDADIDGFDPDDFDPAFFDPVYFGGDGNPPEKEPIYLLKMTCPSTGFIHALRVPPDVRSALEAIRWVNWDIEPEEFSVQT